MTILCRRILASNCCLEREDFEIGYVIGYEDLVLSVVYDMTQMANTSLEMIAETYFLLQQNLPNYCIFQLAYNRIVFWYASFERYIFYSGY